MLTVQRVYELIDALAPFDTQADFDNSGLLVGNPQAEVTGIHLALDVTDRVIDDALAAGANLIVTHHPLMFSARKRLTEADYEGHLLIRLIANGLSLIAAHTNLDQASGGMNDTLAGLLGLENIVGEGFLRVGHSARDGASGGPHPPRRSLLRRRVRRVGGCARHGRGCFPHGRGEAPHCAGCILPRRGAVGGGTLCHGKSRYFCAHEGFTKRAGYSTMENAHFALRTQRV